MRELDATLRARLRRLALAEPPSLGARERARIVARAQEAARRGQGLRLLLWPALAAGAVALLSLSPSGGPPPAPAAPVPAHVARAVPVDPPAPEAVQLSASSPAAPPCAASPVPGVRRQREGAREVVDLGARARFVLVDGAVATLERVDRCHTVLALEEGRVVVHARDLAGGELVVRTPGADVVVHGTVFDVRLGAETLAVSVAEGEVGVVAGAQRARLEAGRAVTLRGARLQLGEVPRAAMDRLLETVRQPARRRPRPGAVAPAPARVPPRGEVREGIPMVHQPAWPTAGGRAEEPR